MKAYLDILKKILEEGEVKESRTVVDTIALTGAFFEHDMTDGFPLLTTKRIPFRLIASELEFFIKGITDKQWLIERDNHIWDEWCSPLIVPNKHDEETRAKMLAERDLGPLYGWQWRHFGADYTTYDAGYEGKGIDQLKRVVARLKSEPSSRRIICMAWNPKDVDSVEPPFCHYGFQVTVVNGRLNLLWNQRSVDTPLGLPFNIASYGLLLHLLAKECGLKEGKLIGFLADTHIYLNQIEGIREQLKRKPYPLPTLVTENFTSIFDWKYTDSKLVDYEHYPTIKFDISV